MQTRMSLAAVQIPAFLYLLRFSSYSDCAGHQLELPGSQAKPANLDEVESPEGSVQHYKPARGQGTNFEISPERHLQVGYTASSGVLALKTGVKAASGMSDSIPGQRLYKASTERKKRMLERQVAHARKQLWYQKTNFCKRASETVSRNIN